MEPSEGTTTFTIEVEVHWRLVPQTEPTPAKISLNGGPKYGDDVLERVRHLRTLGYGYVRIARDIGCTRDTARSLVQRADKDLDK